MFASVAGLPGTLPSLLPAARVLWSQVVQASWVLGSSKPQYIPAHIRRDWDKPYPLLVLWLIFLPNESSSPAYVPQSAIRRDGALFIRYLSLLHSQLIHPIPSLQLSFQNSSIPLSLYSIANGRHNTTAQRFWTMLRLEGNVNNY